MDLVETIPRHGAALVRLTLVPKLSRAERITWIVAREWALIGAVAGMVILVTEGPLAPRLELDPLLIAGYLLGFVATRALTRPVRRAVVRLEIATVRS